LKRIGAGGDRVAQADRGSVMAVNARSLATGKCYATSTVVRRVLGIKGDEVTYEVRGKKARQVTWGSQATVDVATFAADADREVSADFDPKSHPNLAVRP
jgi:hypothetical protein